MPPGFQDEGLHAAVRLREERPGRPVLVLSQYVQRAYAAELLDSGDGTGVGYLLKDRVGQVEQFVDALGEVAAVGMHMGSILTKLDLPPADDVHRRVPAVLAHLRS